jgi:hypothetical protein
MSSESVCQVARIAGWTWAVFTRVYLEWCVSLSPHSGNFWIHPRISNGVSGESRKSRS